MKEDMLKSYLEEFEGLSKDEIIEKMKVIFVELYRSLLEIGLSTEVMIMSANLGIFKDAELSESEKELIQSLYHESKIEEIYEYLKKPLQSGECTVLKTTQIALGVDTVALLIMYAVGFAAVDGVIEDEVKEKIIEIYELYLSVEKVENELKEELGVDELPELPEDEYEFDDEEDSDDEEDDEEYISEKLEECFENLEEWKKEKEEEYQEEMQTFGRLLSNRLYDDYYDVENDIQIIREVVDKYGEMAEEKLEELDEEIQDILDSNYSYFFLIDIVRQIKEMYEYIEDYGVNFNDNNMSYVFSEYNYSASYKSKAIKEFWEKEYEKCPEVIEMRKKEAEEKRKKEEKAKAKYEKDLKKWEEKKKIVEEKRAEKKKEYESELEKEFEENKKSLQLVKEKLILENKNEIQECRKKVEEKKKELEKLGLLAVVKKISLNKEIEKLEMTIKNLERKKEEIDFNNKEEYKKLEEKYKNDNKKISNKVEKEFPMPKEPKKG